MPDRFGSDIGTQVHPIIAVAMIFGALLILALPRKHILAPFLAAAFLIPMDQMVLIGPFHFQMLRVLIIVGWVAVLIRRRAGECICNNGFNGIDYAVALWTITTAIATVSLWQDSAALNNQLGNIYTVFGIYFLLRFFVRNEDDVRYAITVMAYVSAVIAVVMISEHITHRNPYVILGGSRAWTREALMQREGGLRAMGPFQHPILAGTFGAISLPTFIALWKRDRRHRVSAGIGILSAAVITFATESSTPLLAFVAGLFALCMWPLRRQMRPIRWGIVTVLTTLHLVMKAPVWALIARVDLTGGSSSYHRYMLVDTCIHHFSDWWLMGVKSTAEWGWDMWDLANQYVAIADLSGLIPLLCFVAILAYGYKYLGRALWATKVRRQKLFIWSLGAALFANCVAFMGIGYFDQTMVAWYLLLAMIAAASKFSAVAEGVAAAVPSPTSTGYNLEQVVPTPGLAAMLYK